MTRYLVLLLLTISVPMSTATAQTRDTQRLDLATLRERLPKNFMPQISATSLATSTCNNNGVCETWLGDACTTCGDCVGDGACAFLADACNRYNFVGGKSGPVYNQCLNDAYSYLMYFLDYFSRKYVAPGSNIVYESAPANAGDGKCNQYLIAGTCGGFPTESCSNDPQSCGECPTIANISDPNILTGSCDPTQCSKGVCTVGQCANATSCQFNCDSAHYGGSYAGDPSFQSDAVDFSVDAASCPTIATLSDSVCLSGANFISYGLETPGTLHVSLNTKLGSFLAVPDSTGVAGVACPTTPPPPAII
jgi:hypothetical protein